jgi:transposase
MTTHTIGIDISKSRLDVFDLESGLATHFENTISGLKSLRTWLGGRTITRIVFEPTGAYHKALEMRLGGDYPLVKVNPLQARRFAEAQGTKAKTDRTDARVLARMGQALNLRPQPPIPESQRVLKELHTARASLMTERIRLKCRFQQQDIPLLKRQTKALLAHVDRQIAELDVEVAALIGQQTEGQGKMNILTSIPGIGKLTASVILAFLREIGGLERKNVASLAGVAPMTRASGQWVGKGLRQGGPPSVATCPLHACADRDPVQSGPEGQVRPAARSRKTGQGRNRRRHAKAGRTRQRLGQGGPQVGAPSPCATRMTGTRLKRSSPR